MRAWLIVGALAASAGCFGPKIGEGEFICGAGNLCPEGFQCGAGNRCFTPANLPIPDMSLPPPEVGSGALGPREFMTAGEIFFNTEDGSITAADTTVLLAAGATGFHVASQANGGPEVAIWEFTTLTIGPGVIARLSPNSKRAMAWLATDTITLQGQVDLRGFGGFLGLAEKDGATRGNNTTGGGGKGSTTAGKGGGGGGYGAKGGDGMGGGGAGGLAYGNAQMSALHVGAGGGGGGGATAGIGGNGGGALALLASTVIISGAIDVSGNTPPNASSASMVGGGGGGSGGSIMLSAAQLTLENGHKLRAQGGKGGMGANSGTQGGPGAIGRIWTGVRNLTVVGQRDIDPQAADSDTGPLLEFPRALAP